MPEAIHGGHKVPVEYTSPKYLINHYTVCQIQNLLTLLIVVFSAPNNFRSRMAIRETWGSIAHQNDVVLVFLLGFSPNESISHQILHESTLYRDIIQGDFMDTYLNLSLKSISMLNWVNTYCNHFRFMLKIDDDVFLNPKNLFKFLNSQKEDQKVIFGRVLSNELPHRNKADKNFVSIDDYPASSYPDFVVGPSYVYTRLTSREIYSVIFNTSFLNFEDVFLNGLCADKALVLRVHHDDFGVNSGEMTWDLCIIHELISIHDINADNMQLLWWSVQDTRGHQCNLKKQHKHVSSINKLLGRLKNEEVS